MAIKTYYKEKPIMVINKEDIPDFIPVYPKLPNEVYKKIDMRFIKELIKDIDKTILKN